MAPRAQTTKKSDKLGFIKMKNFFVSKNITPKFKGQDTDWEKIFPNYISDKEPVSRM